MGTVSRGPWGAACPCGRPGCTYGQRLDGGRVTWPDEPWAGPGGTWDGDDVEDLDDDAWEHGGREDDDEAEEVLTAEQAVVAAQASLLQAHTAGAGRQLALAPGPEVLALVRARVLGALDRLWTLGWEPADVVRWARRRPGGERSPLVRQALGAALAQRSWSALPEGWEQQARAHDVDVREGRERFLREAGTGQRTASSGRGWLPAWALTAAEALELALALDRQEPMPTVGEVTAASGAPPVVPPGVDPRLLEKVRLLLAKAESTAFPAEAETFTAAAQSLISRHSLQEALGAGSAAAEPGGGGPRGVRIGVDAPYEGQKAALLAAVARANRCSAVWMRQLGSSTVVGFAADLLAVELLFASLLTQAVRGMTAAGADARPGAHTRRPEFRRAYLESFARRIGQRLEEAASAALEDLDEDGAAAGGAAGGTAGGAGGRQRLLPVLAERAAAVDDAVARAFPDLVRRRGPRTLDRAGWASGWAAAELASLDVGQAVTGTRALPAAGSA